MRLLPFLFAIACTPIAPEPIAPMRPRPVDAGTPSDCEAACKRFAECGREEAQPTGRGVTCVQLCTETEASGTVTLMPACVAKSPCDELDLCTYGAPP